MNLYWGDAQLRSWRGQLEVSAGEILRVTPNFGPPGPNAVDMQTAQSVTWHSSTVGTLDIEGGACQERWRVARNGREGTNQLVVELRGDHRTRVTVNLNALISAHAPGLLGASGRLRVSG